MSKSRYMPDRETGQAQPRKRYLIVCEGAKTEPSYLELINRAKNNPVILKYDWKFSSPKEIVSRAKALKDEADKKGKKDPFEKYDAVWCFFDRDDHHFVEEARITARDNSINVAFSDPCFELWLLLHFRDHTAHIQRHPIHRLCEAQMAGYVKTAEDPRIPGLLGTATARAEALIARQIDKGCAYQNPWTDVCTFIRQVFSAP